MEREVVASLVLLLAAVVCYRRSFSRPLAASVPWVGLRDEWFPLTRAHFREGRLGHEFMNEGYDKYSKHGQPYAAPNLARQKQMVLPPADMGWLLQQPEDSVSQPEVMAQMVQTKYFFPALPKGEVFHGSIVKVDLNRHLASLTEAMTDEVRAGLANVWGTKTAEWSSVRVMDTVRRMSTQIAVRVFFGQDVAHDQVFLDHTQNFSLFLTAGSGLLALFTPKVLACVLGPLAALPARYSAWRMNRKLIPLIKARIAQLSSEPCPAPQPNDLLLYHIASALASPSAIDRSPHVIAARLSLLLGFAAIPTTYLTMTNVLLNLASPSLPTSPSPPALVALRTEASSVLAASNPNPPNHWTRTALLSLPLADSFIKETLRLHPFGGIGLLHQVVAPDGVQLPRHPAITAPRGTWLAVAVGALQRDEAVWGEAADEFRPWRFVAGSGEGQGSGSGTLTSASETFLSWSLGRHVCPGRFFAAAVMKMVLAEVVLGYDIKMLEKRPENVAIGSFLMPPEEAQIEVRRRSEAEVLEG